MDIGKELKKEIEDKGYKTNVIRAKLKSKKGGIMPFEVFKNRIKNNSFTYEEVGILKANRYLP